MSEAMTKAKVDRKVGAEGAATRVTTGLVVDDDEPFHDTVKRVLPNYRLVTAYTGWQAMEALSKHHIDVILLDLSLPDTTGLKLIPEILAEKPDVEIVMITSHAEIATAVACTKAGAFDFLAKSYENYKMIGAHIERALANRRAKRADLARRAEDGVRDGIAQIEGTRSHTLQHVAELLRKVAPTPLTVLLQGESGVGKELFARYVHLHSQRPRGSFVAVNLAAMAPTLVESTLFGHEKGAFTGADRQRLGKFELADGGTLFLDEIADLDLTHQAKLLRVIQEREVERLGAAEPSPIDVRLIAATNKDLEAEVMAGRFREDLFFRLNVVRATVPPLRERKDDIPALIELLAHRHARAMNRVPPTFTQEAIRVLSLYPWPGNVRELENLVSRLVVLSSGRSIRLDDIPIEYCLEHLSTLAVWYASRHADSDDNGLYRLAVSQFERYLVRQMVDRCHGNKAVAARKLGVSYSTVKNKVSGSEPNGEAAAAAAKDGGVGDDEDEDDGT